MVTYRDYEKKYIKNNHLLSTVKWNIPHLLMNCDPSIQTKYFPRKDNGITNNHPYFLQPKTTNNLENIK